MEQATTRKPGEPEPLNFSLSPDETDYSLDVFRKSAPGQGRTREMLRLLGAARRGRCLDLSGSDAATVYWLTRSGGEWDSVAPSKPAAEARRRFLADRVTVFSGLPLAFPDKTFDVAVVGDLTLRTTDSDKLVLELHRILKPAGSLVLDVAHSRPFSWLRPLQRGMPAYHAGGQFRSGYSEKELFQIVKDGFDVQEVRSYSRLFVSLLDLLLQRAVQRARIRSDSAIRIKRAYSLAYPFFLAALHLDRLLFWTRGYRLAVLAKRHIWRPRNAPGIQENRPVSKSVLSTVRH